MKLTKADEEYLRGYAQALQDVMRKMTGGNTCCKSYDPIEFDTNVIHSYAFDLKDGGRHHPLADYENREEITGYMLNEAKDFIFNGL